MSWLPGQLSASRGIVANGRNAGRKPASGRDAGGFVALPWSVLDSPAYARLSHPARSLLLEFARQFVRDNNGRLLCSMRHLRRRGWTSADVVTRAKRELLNAGFIFETVMGLRPNKASWYAVTWLTLDRHADYDAGVVAAFERSAYLKKPPVKNAVLIPSRGLEAPSIAPSHGLEKASPSPSHGAIQATFGSSSSPSPGNHLEKPSVVRDSGEAARETIEPHRAALQTE